MPTQDAHLSLLHLVHFGGGGMKYFWACDEEGGDAEGRGGRVVGLGQGLSKKVEWMALVGVSGQFPCRPRPAEPNVHRPLPMTGGLRSSSIQRCQPGTCEETQTDRRWKDTELGKNDRTSWWNTTDEDDQICSYWCETSLAKLTIQDSPEAKRILCEWPH